jgi:hypothetical protein
MPLIAKMVIVVTTIVIASMNTKYYLYKIYICICNKIMNIIKNLLLLYYIKKLILQNNYLFNF